MNADARVNFLMVDDQPAKLLSYEVILRELNENLIRATSAREALEILLKNDVAVILVDVCMPELDGFELAKMLREHPRYEKTAIIFISAIQISDADRVRGYDTGAVDSRITSASAWVSDAALVDISLGRDSSAPIADRLLARSVPFAFATGYTDSAMLPEHLRSIPRLNKPYAVEEVRRVVDGLVTRTA